MFPEGREGFKKEVSWQKDLEEGKVPGGQKDRSSRNKCTVSNAKDGDLGKKPVCLEDVCGEKDREAGN